MSNVPAIVGYRGQLVKVGGFFHREGAKHAKNGLVHREGAKHAKNGLVHREGAKHAKNPTQFSRTKPHAVKLQNDSL